MNENHHRNSCPVCSSTLIELFLTRTNVPVHQNLLMNSYDSARLIFRGDLQLNLCNKCEFIFNNAFDLSKLNYGKDYENTQFFSHSFESYVTELVDYLVKQKKIQNCCIVEIGCGSGYFLKKLVEAGPKNHGYGFDLTYEGPETDLDGRLNFKQCYYGPEYENIVADIVICRHVIEHIHNPVEFLKAIKLTLKNSPNALVFFETPDVEWILKNKIVWDFFYEHCSYFNANSLKTTFENSGFKVQDVKNIFGNQYLWLEAIVSSEHQIKNKKTSTIADSAKEFASMEEQLQKKLKEKFQNLTLQGKVALWGAGAKGVTLANLIDPDCELIDCIVDINPKKQNHYVPGTGHSVVNYKELGIRGITTAISMNPNYYTENKSLLEKANLKVELIEF